MTSALCSFSRFIVMPDYQLMEAENFGTTKSYEKWENISVYLEKDAFTKAIYYKIRSN